MQDFARRVVKLPGVFLLVKLYHSDARVDNMLQYVL